MKSKKCRTPPGTTMTGVARSQTPRRPATCGCRPSSCSTSRARYLNFWWSGSRTCPEKMHGRASSGRLSTTICLRVRPRTASRRQTSSSGWRARFCRSRHVWITLAVSALSHHHPPGPVCWPTSWPPATTSTNAPGWWGAARARSSWSSSTGFGAGSAIRRVRVGFSPVVARRPASMPSSRRARRRAILSVPPST